MSSCIPTRAVVPGVGHINAVVAVPEFVVRSIVFANVICSSKAEKSITLQLCWFTSSLHMRFQHHRRSEKHHTPTKVGDHFWSCTIQSFINQAQQSKKTRSCVFYLSVGHVGADVLTRVKLGSCIFQSWPIRDLHNFQLRIWVKRFGNSGPV